MLSTNNAISQLPGKTPNSVKTEIVLGCEGGVKKKKNVFQSQPGAKEGGVLQSPDTGGEILYGTPKNKVTEKNGSARSRLPRLSLQISPVSSKSLVLTVLGKKWLLLAHRF